MAAIVDKDNTLDINAVSEGLQKALPNYARPLFIRKLNEVELTGKNHFSLNEMWKVICIFVLGTYKLKKLDLQKDGFDIGVIKDQLYYCDSKGIYKELTPEIYKDIHSGKIRL